MATIKTAPTIKSGDKLLNDDHAKSNGVTTKTISYAPDDGCYVSKEVYMAIYYEGMDANYEWNNGYLEAKPVASVIQAKMHLWFLMLLHHFLTENPLAEMMLLEIGFDMYVPNPKIPGQYKNVTRKPDIGIVRNDNAVTLHEQDRKYHGICDLCVESLSDSSYREIARDVCSKRPNMNSPVCKSIISWILRANI